MKEFMLFIDFENGLCDIYTIKANNLEEAVSKKIKENKAKLNSPMFKDRTSKIIKIQEFK
jgi:hypothetical protein